MEAHLLEFLVFYILDRLHGSLKRELGVKTPYEAFEKPVVSKAEPWYELKQEFFLEKPLVFKIKSLNGSVILSQSKVALSNKLVKLDT